MLAQGALLELNYVQYACFVERYNGVWADLHTRVSKDPSRPTSKRDNRPNCLVTGRYVMRGLWLWSAIFAVFLASSASANSKFAWPEGRRAAVVLTYDDAIAA